jgi:hypothetical protein
VQQLRATQPQQVEKVGVEARHTAANPGVEIRIDSRTAAKHAIDELANPSAVTRVQSRGPSIERRIEKLAATEIGADFGRGETSVRHAAAASVKGDTARCPGVAICLGHML